MTGAGDLDIQAKNRLTTQQSPEDMSTIPVVFGYSILGLALLGGLWILAFRKPKTPNAVVLFCAAFAALGFACSYLPYLAKVEAGPVKLIMWESAPQFLALEKRVKQLDEEVTSKERQLAELSRRSEQLTVDNNSAQQTITRQQQEKELESLYLEAAFLGSKPAFDRLEQLSNDTTYLEYASARKYWELVLSQEAGTTVVGRTTTLDSESAKKSLDELAEDLKNLGEPKSMFSSGHTKVIDTIKLRKDISKRDRLAFLVAILETSQNIHVLGWAGRAFNEIAGVGFSPLATKEILRWWKSNADKVE